MAKDGHATFVYRDSGYFDQIMVSQQLVPADNNDYSTFKYWKPGIYNKPFLIQKTGQWKDIHYVIKTELQDFQITSQFIFI